MPTIDTFVNKKFGPSAGLVHRERAHRDKRRNDLKLRKNAERMPKQLKPKTTRAKRLAPETRRLQLLEAAIETFCLHGVDGTTMHQLADAAGVSYGLFYHYFNSKEQVLLEAVDQLSEVETVESFLADHEAPLSDHLLSFSKVYQASMESRKEVYWLLFSESRKRPSVAERLSKSAERFRRAMIGYLSARQKAQEISLEVDLDVATRVVFSYLFMRLLWIENEPPVEDHMAVIIQGLLRRS